jgi:outer membrane protein assembly factor BamA
LLASDFSYTRVELDGRWYLPLARPQTNLNIQLRLGLSDSAPFGEHAYEIGGGELIRGMQSAQHTGDILTLLNVEYLSGFFAYPAWRWVLFADLGNVYTGEDVNLLRQHLRGGVGMRWKLEALTNTDLRIDLAWDPDEGRAKPYVSTSLTF